MKNNLHPEWQDYLMRQIEQGRFVEIAAREDRGANHWVLIAQQHSSERSREQDLNAVVPRGRCVVSVLNPTNGVIGALAVEPPQSSLLDEQNTLDNDIPPREMARRTAIEISTRSKLDHEVAMLLNTGTDITFKDLVTVAGTEENLKGSLNRLKRFKNKGMNVQTIDQVVAIQPETILTRTVPASESEQVTLSYMGLEYAARGELMLVLHINADHLGSQLARLSTLNNQRTLKLLQAAQLMDLNVEAELSKEYSLRTGKWICVLLGLTNEADLLAKMGSVGNYIVENF